MEKPKSYCDVVAHFDSNNVHRIYHDTAYGFPINDDNELFERLILEINQAGLSWDTILKKQQSGDIADAKLHGDFAFFIHVHFANDGTAFKVLSELVHNRSNHAAGTTPCGPKVHEYGGIRFQD